jgi:hypothetical protein
MQRVPRLSNAFEIWFRPKSFESECRHERLGALVIKHYVPTGGDIVMRRLRRDHPERRWVTSSLESLCSYEKRTRLNESVHLIGFVGFGVLAARKVCFGFAYRSWAGDGFGLGRCLWTLARCPAEIQPIATL